LYRDSIDLDKIYKQIVNSAEFALPTNFFSNPVLNLEGEIDAHRGHRNAIEFKKKIEIFKKVKFWELGHFHPQSLDSNGTNLLNLLLENPTDQAIPDGIQNLPPQMLASIPKEIWKQFAVSFVNETQDYIKQMDPNFIEFGAAIQYVFPPLFKTIDFLYKQDFIDEKTIKSFLKDENIFLMTTMCTDDVFVKRYSHIFRPTHPATYDLFPKKLSHMMQAFIDIEDNWFWPFGFKFYNGKPLSRTFPKLRISD
jgi:hypothetical protein